MRPTRSRKANSRPQLVLIVLVLFLWQQSVPPSLAQTANSQANAGSQLKIVVLAGEDGVNIIKAKTAVKPVVEVRDKNNLPVAALYVTFIAPENGPRVIFEHGSSTYTTLTDASGHATVHVMRPLGPGRFKINVRTSFKGEVATAVIAQANFLTLAAATAAGAGAAAAAGTAAGGGISGLMIGVIAGAAVAAAGIAVGATRGGGGGQKTPTGPTGSIGGAGTPTVGPPH